MHRENGRATKRDIGRILEEKQSRGRGVLEGREARTEGAGRGEARCEERERQKRGLMTDS